MKSAKRAKIGSTTEDTEITEEQPPRTPSLTKGAHTTLLHLVQHLNAFEDHVADNLQALGGELIDCVLRSVVEDIPVAVVEVDDVETRHATLNEWKVIVLNCGGTSEEM